MYRQAIAKKKKGAVTGSVLVGIFAAVSLLIALKVTAGWFLFGFNLLFEVLIVFSVIQNNSNIKKMEQSYPGFLEHEVDSCDTHVAGKYFFLDKYLVDPFNARMIRYDEITSVKTTETSNRHHGAIADREGRTVYIKTKSLKPGAMPMIFNDFNSDMAHSDSDSVSNYTRFVDLLNERVGDDLKIIVKRLS